MRSPIKKAFLHKYLKAVVSILVATAAITAATAADITKKENAACFFFVGLSSD